MELAPGSAPWLRQTPRSPHTPGLGAQGSATLPQDHGRGWHPKPGGMAPRGGTDRAAFTPHFVPNGEVCGPIEDVAGPPFSVRVLGTGWATAWTGGGG